MNRTLLREPTAGKRKSFRVSSNSPGTIDLQDEGENLPQYLNVSPFIFLMLDVHGKLQIINKKGCEILGYKNKKEIIGKSWFANFTPSAKRKLHRKIFSRVITNNIDVMSRDYREVPTLRKDGSISFIKWRYALVHDRKGKPAGIVCYGEDVTGKKELEAKFMKAMLEGQEVERKRLAKDMHDGLAVLLTGARLNLAAIEASNGKMTAKQRKLLESSMALITSALNELKTITLNLSPGALQDAGLVSALKELFDKLNKSHKVNLRLRSYGIKKRFTPGVETAVYRIAQELIHNAIKHSGAKKIDCRLLLQGDVLTLTVEDNGVGFDTSHLFDREGKGMKNIRSRVKHLRGFFHVESFPRKGTMAMVEIPVVAGKA